MTEAKAIIVFNTTTGEHLVVDEEGRNCFPAEWAISTRPFAKDLLDSGKLVEVDPETIGEDADASLILLKKRVDELNNPPAPAPRKPKSEQK